jgi:hypothetical protein
MLEAGLIVSRFLHYTATLTLFGISLFPLYTYPGLTAATPRLRRTRLRLRPTWLWLRRGLLRRTEYWLQFRHRPLLSLPGRFPPWRVINRLSRLPAPCVPATGAISVIPDREKLGRFVSHATFPGCCGLTCAASTCCVWFSCDEMDN